ncbi:MAG: hypothetical protein ACI93T_002808 [Porticoccaceae bacterium]|jgi:hypothetical protein
MMPSSGDGSMAVAGFYLCLLDIESGLCRRRNFTSGK